MKLDRRGFIKLIVGGAAGFHLTPLPWKLIDDSAIWTQNWPWVPKVARYPDISYNPTVCTLCEGGCGVKVRLVNGKKTIKVEGLTTAPVNQGKVCPVGAAGPQYQYGLARFAGPLKRIGSRGSGAYAKISWDEALKTVGDRLTELRNDGQAHTVVMISGRGNDLTKSLAKRFMDAYGSPNLVDMPSLRESRAFAEKAQFGRECDLGYDLENAKYILSFGCGLIEGWGSPIRSIRTYSGWRGEGSAKLVQVDTYASLTASKADEWAPVAPGTEGALALGLANFLIENELYNKEFVDQYTFGFEDFKRMVLNEYTPAKVSAITGLKVDVIERLAKEFGEAERPVAIAGKGKGAMPTPVYDLMAVQALNALVGNINQPGGVIVKKELPLAPWPEPELDPAAEEGLAAPRLDLAGTEKYPLTSSLLNELVESINTGRFYPVNVLILDRANPDYFGADPAAFRKALSKIPLVVTLSNAADDTSIQADMVLPESANFEGPAISMNPPTLPYPLFGAGGPVLSDSRFDTKPAGDILINLAQAVGDAVGEAILFESLPDAVAMSAAGLFESGRGKVAVIEEEGEIPGEEFGEEIEALEFGDDIEFLDALVAGLFWYDPSFEFGEMAGAFQTPSAKFEFVSQTIQSALYDYIADKGEEAALADMGFSGSLDQVFMPHFEPYVSVEASSKYPLVLAPVEQFKLVTSSIGNAPYLTKLVEDNTLTGDDLVVQINPLTAEGLHLAEGDKAWLKTKKGRLAVRVHLFEGARPDVVYAPLGLGHSGFGYYLRGKGVNPMEIVEAKVDPLSGQAVWWGTRANLTKV